MTSGGDTMAEERVITSLRIPKGLHEWLKANIGDKTINDVIIELVTEYRIKTEVTPEVKALYEKGKYYYRALKELGVDYCVAFGELRVYYFDENAQYRKDIEVKVDPRPWIVSQINLLKDNPIGNNILNEYFEPALKLSLREQTVLYNLKV
jgi:hypothetical protein